ncbi:hypothetical protein Taro_008878 [Colocasia esculenta]|uniref:Uncharacterized protein n=1 Tax=Colocasia esculenta TaxID=4460 RepID=A0A843TYJ6_COLES|nr:hypothetical protein [Colocasia esculenta]
MSHMQALQSLHLWGKRVGLRPRKALSIVLQPCFIFYMSSFEEIRWNSSSDPLKRYVGTLLVVADLSILLMTVSHLVVFEVCKHRRKCLDQKVFLSKRLILLCFLLSPRSGRQAPFCLTGKKGSREISKKIFCQKDRRLRK